MSGIIHPELSYKIMGVLFNVHNQLGGGYQEKHYQKAVSKLFDDASILYKEQVKVEIKSNKNLIGTYFIDFVVEDKVVLEIKARPKFSKRDIMQVLSYLKETGINLGILAAFSKYELKYKRILKGY